MAGFTQKTIEIIKRIVARRQEKGPLGEEKMALVIAGYPEETFTVVKGFTEGGINQCYRAEILMVTREHRPENAKLLLAKSMAFIKRDEKTFVPFRGIVAEIEELRKVDEYLFYRAVFVPKLWLLTQTRGNQIFLDKTTPEILEAVLVDGGLTKNEFEFRLQGDYSKRWEYVCQYGENHFNFFSRWLEHEGMYFYFELEDEGDKLIVTDTKIGHVAAPQAVPLQYHPVSGLEAGRADEVLSGFSVRYAGVPKSVTLKDYNYRRPSLEVTGKAEIAPEGAGDLFIYGGHLQSPEEAGRIARVRAEEIACRQRVFYGQSTAPFLRPGFIFEVQGHYDEAYNGRYLVTTIRHEVNQAAYLTAGLRRELGEEVRGPLYRNSFTAIPADVQYRPPLSTPKPRFYGVMNAHIDAESSGEYAELDSQGRYKVIMPFDLSGRQGGKASAWLRMAQPYAGSNHGMHFPLHKGTEVLLTFIDGDPDRPIIAAAVPNPETPSVLNDQSAKKAGFVTPGGASLVADDDAGKEQVALRQGNDAMIGLRGSGLGSEAGTWSNYAWHYAGIGELAVANFFTCNYNFGTYIQSVGFRKQALGIYNLLMEGSNMLPELLPTDKSAKDPSSLMEKIIPIATMLINIFAYTLIEKQVQARIKAKLVSAVPNVGYGIYCDNSGAITYMKAPFTQDNPDIGVTSATGSIDVVAGKNVNIWAGQELAAGAKEKVYIHSDSSGGAVEVTAAKVNIKSTADGVRIDSNTNGVTIATSLGHIDIKSQCGAVQLVRENDEGVASGKIEVGSTGNINANTAKGSITLEAGESKLYMSSAGLAELTLSHGLTIKVGESKIEVEPAGITITSPYDVKINDLTITKTAMSYKGPTASIANVLKIK